ncbi:MAG: DPP IV N-terminal domain-containing protein [Gemmatimonadota bacterium]|jgi:dipeptidyl aminopeptidase/acylaminoacyl peptidase
MLPFVLPAVLMLAAGAAAGQGTLEDYQRAERFLGDNARALVAGDAVRPVWLENDRFWYRVSTRTGTEFVLLDPAARRRGPAFDHARLAAALSLANDTSYVPDKLPFTTFEYVEGGRSLRVALDTARGFLCDLSAYSCVGETPERKPVTEVRSPDGAWIAFERDENLWVRPAAGGEAFQLSTDGEPDWGYAVNPEACCDAVTRVRLKREKRPILVWSPDSRRIATYRLDERGVKDLNLLETATGRPILHSYKYALPGDSVIPRYEMWVFDVAGRTGVRSDRGMQDAVNTRCCWFTSDTLWNESQWGQGSDHFYYTHGQRDYGKLELIDVDAATGAARKILEERSPTFVETTLRTGGFGNWRVINGDREVIWFSERDGWGHLYLYDAFTGTLKNRITEGPWLVLDLLRVDEATRTIWFTALGREPGRDPYYRHLYRVGLDGRGLTLLTPEDADHQVAFTPSGRYIVDTWSTRQQPPTTVLRRPDGSVVMTVQESDVSQYVELGGHWPESFTVKARDGVTDVYGLLFRPTNFDSTKAYPIIDYIYPGPQSGPIGSRGFSVSPGGNAQALAELGFVVMQVDAMGTPFRNKAFHDTWYGNMGDNGIPDHVAALRQLGARYRWIDQTRVGIFGHSGGGFSSTDAILRYPDVYKVAVSSAGNHDNRSYDYTWGEKYQGLLVKNGHGGDNFDSQANQLLAKNLRGKLFLLYGTLDDNVHPNNTLLLVDALISANKNFDLLVLPNRNHGFGGEPYVIRRTWDYFVKNLLGVDPPTDFEITRF